MAEATRNRGGSRRAAVAALALGAGVTWNISNVGPLAQLEAHEYNVSLAVVGLFTTALFVTHAAVQVPGGRAADRVGARTVGFAALAAVAAGNALCLVAPETVVALAGRAIVGLGSGAGFVAGAEYMRHSHASAFLQGLYGAATMAGGGLAIAIVPQLDGTFGWRAPYWSALAVAAVTAAVLASGPRDVRERSAPRRRIAADRQLLGLGVVHATTFGLSVVAANWIVPLLERHGHERGTAASLGAFVLLGGILTRPLGGLAVAHPALLPGALVTGALSYAALALPLPLALLGAAAVVAGLAAGLPFAYVFSRTQSLRPEAPGAAVGFVNTIALTSVVAGTPLLGLTFALPGEGRIGFAVVAVLWLSSLLVIPRNRHQDG